MNLQHLFLKLIIDEQLVHRLHLWILCKLSRNFVATSNCVCGEHVIPAAHIPHVHREPLLSLGPGSTQLISPPSAPPAVSASLAPTLTWQPPALAAAARTGDVSRYASLRDDSGPHHPTRGDPWPLELKTKDHPKVRNHGEGPYYAKRALTPQSLNVKLGPRHKGHKGRAVWLA